MTRLRENRVKRKLQAGDIATVISGHNSPDVIDFLGSIGFDGVWLEGEHGPVDYADIPDMTRACDVWGMTSIVRINLNLEGVLYRTLDLGAQGIVTPHIDTADQARDVVKATKFAPVGSRGMATSRQGYGVNDYFAKANDETLIVVLIEDILAIQNLKDILEVNNIDVFFVAPGDLSQSMGFVGQPTHPEVVETIDNTIRQITMTGKIAGALVNDENVKRYIDKGARFLLNSWQEWVISNGKNYLGKVNSATT